MPTLKFAVVVLDPHHNPTQVVGPFYTEDAAVEWARDWTAGMKQMFANWQVVPLVPPIVV